ncbi:hypothetical protein HYPP_01086 [Hyphomicrobium sp. ghe19]|nr:hypothetical protein HYPP_01086 [Hyphomicrobium sp. ghe19]
MFAGGGLMPILMFSSPVTSRRNEMLTMFRLAAAGLAAVALDSLRCSQRGGIRADKQQGEWVSYEDRCSYRDRVGASGAAFECRRQRGFDI